MKLRNPWRWVTKLATLSLALTFSLVAPALKAQVVQRKEPFPQLSSEQRQQIAAVHPDPVKPVFVSLKVRVSRGDLSQVDIVGSCGVPDVDHVVQKWVWDTYHYDRSFSGETVAKVRVNSPIVQSPQARLSWRAWQEVNKADPLNQGKSFIAHFNIVIRQGKITDVQLVKSSGLPIVDQEFRDFIRTRWVAAAGANQNITASMRAHRGYYPQ